MKTLLAFFGRVFGIALGIVLYDIAKRFWGWPGVVALLAVLVAIYFAADSVAERRKR